jgi:hypothetical protein
VPTATGDAALVMGRVYGHGVNDECLLFSTSNPYYTLGEPLDLAMFEAGEEMLD